MGRHIYIDLHLVRMIDKHVLTDPLYRDSSDEVLDTEYERIRSVAFATYRQACHLIDDKFEVDAISDWTTLADDYTVWSIALPKKADMNMDLLMFVEEMRAKGIISGYSVYGQGA